MASTALRLGPWPSGLAQRDFSTAPYATPPTALRFVTNLDVTDTGTLVARPGCRKCGSSTMYTDLSTNGLFSLLGSVDLTTSIKYAVIATHDGGSPGTTKVYSTIKPHDTTQYTVAPGGSLSGIYASLFQYNNLIYFVGAPGGGTGQSRTSMTAGTWTAVGTMPKGELSFVVRERAFVIDKAANRMYWSKATDPTTWAAPDGGFVDINPGDGQMINDVVVVNSQLYIFKRNKTFLFTFTSDPAIDGQLTLISNLIGAYSATLWTGGIFIVNDRSVYRMTNNVFTDIAVNEDWRGNMALDYVPNAVIGLENDKLIVGPSFTGSSQVFSHVSMNLHTGAWSLRAYQNADGTFTSAAAPSTKQIGWSDTDTTLSMGGRGVLYGHGTRVLSMVRTAYAFSDDKLDVDGNGTTISPQYALITPPATGGEYDTWKRLHWLDARVNNTLSGGDNPAALELRSGPALTTDQTVSIPAGTYGGKVPVRSMRFRALSIAVNKPIKNLGALASSTTGNFMVWEILAHASSHGRQVNTS
jgi:hypothetical protein